MAVCCLHCHAPQISHHKRIVKILTSSLLLAVIFIGITGLKTPAFGSKSDSEVKIQATVPEVLGYRVEGSNNQTSLVVFTNYSGGATLSVIYYQISQDQRETATGSDSYYLINSPGETYIPLALTNTESREHKAVKYLIAPQF